MHTWIVSDGAAGNELQALAAAQALDAAAPRVLRLQARLPWRWLAPQWAPVLDAEDWMPPLPTEAYPQLAVGAGRVGAAALLSIKRLSPATRTLQILAPRVATQRFDAVLVPRHDGLSGDRVISIDGSVHAIDDAWLARERAAMPDPPPGPRTLVLIGGPRRGVRIDASCWSLLAQRLQQWHAEEGGSALIVGSRRTPASWREALGALQAPWLRHWYAAADGANPYRSALAWADRLVVSADSVNMLSEAMATGRPVYALQQGRASGKLGRFHACMQASGRLQALSDASQPAPYPPLRELGRVRAQLQALLFSSG